jgi:hypothetical protein
MRTARVPILVRSDLGDDLAADVTVGQPIRACRDHLPGDHLDRRHTDGALHDWRRKFFRHFAKSSCARLFPDR